MTKRSRNLGLTRRRVSVKIRDLYRGSDIEAFYAVQELAARASREYVARRRLRPVSPAAEGADCDQTE